MGACCPPSLACSSIDAKTKKKKKEVRRRRCEESGKKESSQISKMDMLRDIMDTPCTIYTENLGIISLQNVLMVI